MAALQTATAASLCSKASFGSVAGFKASKSALSVSAAPCVCPRCKANNAAKAVSQSAGFASVAVATPPPASANPLLVPAILGVGILGGATAALMQGGSSTESIPVVVSPENGALVPRVKRAAPAALATMAATFPNSMQEEVFVKAVAAELFNLGFRRDNCIALVNTCRDEVCRPVVNLIDREFGMSFNIAGLGGLVNCGKTGFKAAMSHSPEFPCDQTGKPRERYIFFGFPHVSIGESGQVGSLLRRGRGKPSSACGALIAIKNDIAKGGPVSEDVDDDEYVQLKKQIVSRVATNANEAPSLVQVTKAALAAITDEIEKLVSLTVDPATADYAVVTGVQIHSGNQIPGEPFRIERTCDYIAPNVMYAVINGEKHVLHTEINQINTIKSVPAGSLQN